MKLRKYPQIFALTFIGSITFTNNVVLFWSDLPEDVADSQREVGYKRIVEIHDDLNRPSLAVPVSPIL